MNELSYKWDSYVKKHYEANLYHLSFFKSVVESTYHHHSFYFIAIDDNSEIRGILPLFLINSFFYGKELVSLPFCDYGGILADTPDVFNLLFNKATDLYHQQKCTGLELRQINKQYFQQNNYSSQIAIKTSKVRMLLKLPQSPDLLFSSFAAKLRSQIRKPQRDGCICVNGGLELLNDFYDVFVFNMRDLGSPVHSKDIMKQMLLKRPECTRIFLVYHQKMPVACSLVSGFNEILVNPWASFKRTHQKIAPNMLLYWEMLNYAVCNGYRFFDFGRSTSDEGTYKFKAQWGALPQQLYWYKYGNSALKSEDDTGLKKSFMKLWCKLPLPITCMIGPVLRRQIHL